VELKPRKTKRVFYLSSLDKGKDMVISLAMQWKILLFSILAGILTGFLFDIYRIFRGFENIPKIIIIIEDILFWILTAVIVFVFMLFTDYAYISSYVYVAIGVGIYLYMSVVSRYVTSLQYMIIKLMAKILRVSIKFMFYPMRLLKYSLISKNQRNFKRNDLNNN
jgi:spore cortex biosynthesis protein YabQ